MIAGLSYRLRFGVTLNTLGEPVTGDVLSAVEAAGIETLEVKPRLFSGRRITPQLQDSSFG